MIKTEIICETCDEQYIIVTKEKEPMFCPFCQTPLEIDESYDGEDDD